MTRSRRDRGQPFGPAPGLPFGGHIPNGNCIAAHDIWHLDKNCFVCNPNREVTKEQLAEECVRQYMLLDSLELQIRLMSEYDLSSDGEQKLLRMLGTEDE